MEGGKLIFNFKLTRPAPSSGLVVRLSLLRDTDPLPGDVQYFVNGSTNITSFQLIRGSDGLITDARVTIRGGATEARLVSNVVNDRVAEAEESATYALVVNRGYNIDSRQNSASFTFTDYPVISLSSQPAIVREGQQITFNFRLTKPAPAGGLVVRLALSRDTDPLPGDTQFFVTGSSNITNFQIVRGQDGLINNALVTIAQGAREAKLVSNILQDGVSEGLESITFLLAVGRNYSIDARRNSASYTLQDGR